MKKSQVNPSSVTVNRESIRKMVITGMLIAVTLLLGLTPIGIIRVGAISLTTMFIPVIIGLLMEGVGVGSILGGVFGLISLYQAYTTVGLFNIFFQNPLCSVLPRILIAPVAYLAYKPLKKLLKNSNILTWTITAAVGTLANTVMVLSSLYILYSGTIENIVNELPGLSGQAASVFLFGIAVSNGVPEVVFAAIVVPAIMVPLSKIAKKTI